MYKILLLKLVCFNMVHGTYLSSKLIHKKMAISKEKLRNFLPSSTYPLFYLLCRLVFVVLLALLHLLLLLLFLILLVFDLLLRRQ